MPHTAPIPGPCAVCLPSSMTNAGMNSEIHGSFFRSSINSQVETFQREQACLQELLCSPSCWALLPSDFAQRERCDTRKAGKCSPPFPKDGHFKQSHGLLGPCNSNKPRGFYRNNLPLGEVTQGGHPGGGVLL